jgi:hypothetical protein
MKQITPAQHLAASVKNVKLQSMSSIRGVRSTDLFEYSRFCKPMEPQADAIKRLMREVKARPKKPDPRLFSRDTKTLSNTAAYVHNYYALNKLGTPPYKDLSTNPTEWPEGPEVELSEVTEVTDDISDLI